MLQRVQASGRCLILRKYTPADLQRVLPHLSRQRLALDVYFREPGEARALLARLERWEFDD